MMRLLNYLDKWSKTTTTLLGLFLVALLGLLDYGTGAELSFSIFYLIPISLVTWLAGRRAGFALSAISASAWLTADLAAGHIYSHPGIPYWNTLVRLGFFLIVTVTLSRLRTLQERQIELSHFIIHDLRAPLGVIMTGLQTLQEIETEGTASAQRDVVEMGLASGERMLILINSILDLAQLESGRMPLRPEEVELKPMIQAAVDQFSLLAKRKKVSLDCQFETELEKIIVDPAVTGRILNNLLSNALKFSPPNSRIVILVRPESPNTLAFSVTDQGQGIAKEWVDKVFDKFTQVEGGPGRGTPSSGLGLTFCRLAVEAQGGHISLESQVGTGTTVTFTLPVRPA